MWMSTIAPMSDRHTITPYPLRLPPELKTRVEEVAKKNNRSFNAEVASRLEASFTPQAVIPTENAAPIPPDQFDRLVGALAEKTVKLLLEAKEDQMAEVVSKATKKGSAK